MWNGSEGGPGMGAQAFMLEGSAIFDCVSQMGSTAFGYSTPELVLHGLRERNYGNSLYEIRLNFGHLLGCIAASCVNPFLWPHESDHPRLTGHE